MTRLTCTCPCHTNPHVRHVVPCCRAPSLALVMRSRGEPVPELPEPRVEDSTDDLQLSFG